MFRILLILVLLSGCASVKHYSTHYKEIGEGNNKVTDFLITPGNQFVFSAFGNKISIYRIESPEMVASIDYPDSISIQAIALSADSTILITGTRQGILFIQNLILNTTETIEISDEPITSLAMDTSKTKIACGTMDGTVYILDANGKILNIQKSHKKMVSGICYSLDGLILASSGLDGKVFFTFVEDDYYSIFISNRKSACRSIAFSPDGSSFYAGYDNGKVYSFKINPNKDVIPIGDRSLIGWVTDLDVGIDNKSIAASSANGNIAIFLSFGMKYHFEFKESVKEVQFINTSKDILNVIVSREGKGLCLISASNMKLK